MKTLAENIKQENVELETYYDINSLLQGNKKIVAFMGASKSGTSFMVNNIAELLSTKGVNVAILDATQNKNSYYIYTKNEENLRKIAATSIQELAQGEAKGIKVNNNLTVYTALPGEDKHVQAVEPILETLLKNHSLILIDCDFKTPLNYFEYAMELYLVQTMDTLTIQTLTETLSNLKNRGVLRDSKIRIIINKHVEVNGITEKDIIGAMAFYNDPGMAYMKELFNRNYVPYMTIPFEKEIYERHLEKIANCNINLVGYPREFIELLEQLSKEIYPFVSKEKIDN